MRFSLLTLTTLVCGITAHAATVKSFRGIDSLAFDARKDPSRTTIDPRSKRPTLVERATPIGTRVGCFQDAPYPDGRVLENTYISRSDMTMSTCITYCTTQGYKYGGVEYTSECWCGNTIRTGTYTGRAVDQYIHPPTKYGAQVADSECNMPCSGDKTQTCGGRWKINLYILPDCPTGYSAWYGNKNQTLCCAPNYTPYQTTCCASGKVEIGTTGVCCASGSTVVSGKCVAPSGKSTSSRRRRLQIALPPSDASKYGLEANKDGSLCPTGFAACPIASSYNTTMDGYECLDTQTELESCGGCRTLGTGVDCTNISGARLMGCNSGRCEVYHCQKGWKRSKDGSKCIRRG